MRKGDSTLSCADVCHGSLLNCQHTSTLESNVDSVQLFSKFTNRIQLGAKVAILISIASSYLAIMSYRNIISAVEEMPHNKRLPHLRNRTSSINIDLFDGQNSSTSRVTAAHMPIVRLWLCIKTKPNPVFVLYIGPHKTATSDIQCDLTRYRKELYD